VFRATTTIIILLLSIPAFAQSFDEQRIKLGDTLAPQLLDLASWATRNGLSGERDRVYEQLIHFQPENRQARRILRYRRTKEVWKQSSGYRRPGNKKEENLPEFSNRQDAILVPYRDQMKELLAREGAKASFRHRHAAYLDLLALDPEDEALRGLAGESRLGDAWVLTATAEAHKRQESLPKAADAARDAVAEPKASPPTDQESEFSLEWSAGFETPKVRVVGTVSENEIRRVCRFAEAAAPIFSEAVNARTELFDNTVIHLFKPDDGRTFLKEHPGVTDSNRAFALKLKHWTIPATAHVVSWAREEVVRVDAAVRQAVALLLWRQFKITLDHGWVSEGVGLYMTRLIAGTRLNWFVTPSEYARSPEEDAFKNRLMQNKSNWLEECAILLKRRSPGFQTLMGRNVNDMSTEDLVMAYALAQYLIEGRPRDVPAVLRMVGKKVPAHEIASKALDIDLPALEEQFKRWVSETNSRR